jgi:hypothetical protein
MEVERIKELVAELRVRRVSRHGTVERLASEAADVIETLLREIKK